MDNAQDILVVILSSFLALFLLLNIIFLIIAIRVILVVKRVTAKAEQLADKAEAFGDFVQHAATPLVIGRIFSTFSDKVFKRSAKTKRK
jgi:hypothetical protein